MLSDKNYKFSIIIPAYNVGQYIRECIRSVYSSEISAEIIVVNDGSTDDTLSVIEACAHEVDNIVIVNKKNGGLSSARNAGIERAKGEYLVFLDGDDWLDNSSLSSLDQYLKVHSSDIIILDFVKYWSEERKEVVSDNLAEKVVLSGRDVFKHYLAGNVTIAAWNKVIKRELLLKAEFRFPIGKWYEDVPMGNLFYDAATVVKLNYPFYFYRQRAGSITRTFNPRVYEKHDVLILVKEFLMARGSYQAYELEFRAFYVKICLILMSIFVMKSSLSFKEKKEYIQKFFQPAEAKDALKGIFSNPFVSKKELIYVFMARDLFFVANKLINLKEDSL